MPDRRIAAYRGVSTRAERAVPGTTLCRTTERPAPATAPDPVPGRCRPYQGAEACLCIARPMAPVIRAQPQDEAPLLLIAEDDSSIAALLALVVEELGYRPLVASTGVQALALARAQWPAVVLTDLMMPGLSGTALIAALRAEATATGRSPVPVILMSAVALSSPEMGVADALLPKPFDLADLEHLLAQVQADCHP